LEYEEEGKEKRGLVDVWGKGKEIKMAPSSWRPPCLLANLSGSLKKENMLAFLV
jgi:hypothetical protein